MDFSVTQVSGARALRLEGELDLKSVPTLDELLDDAVAQGGPIVVDLTRLTFVDSTGIRSIARAAVELEKNGWCVYLHTDGGQVEKVLRVVNLNTVPNIHVADHSGSHTHADA